MKKGLKINGSTWNIVFECLGSWGGASVLFYVKNWTTSKKVRTKVLDALSPVVECSPMARETGVQIIPKTKEMVLNTSLLNTQHYKVRIKGKVEQSKERRSALPNTSV